MAKLSVHTNLSYGACVIIAIMEFMYMIAGKNVLILKSGIATPLYNLTHIFFQDGADTLSGRTMAELTIRRMLMVLSISL